MKHGIQRFTENMYSRTLGNTARFDIKTCQYPLHPYSGHLAFGECLKTVGRNCMLISSYRELKGSFPLPLREEHIAHPLSI